MKRNKKKIINKVIKKIKIVILEKFERKIRKKR